MILYDVFIFLVFPFWVLSSQPHIVFIVVDDLGWNDVGYNNPMFNTPTIDQLAADGVKLVNYYVANKCVPSRNMLMSGRHVIDLGLQHGKIGHHPWGLPLGETTIAEKLKEVGYSTHIVGKWHCGFYTQKALPHERGFDTFFGYVNAKIDHYSHTFSGRPDLRRNDECVADQYMGEYSTIMFAKESQDIISAHDPNKPMFLYLSFTADHEPLEVPPQYINQYKSTITDSDRRCYAGMTSCVDEAIANVTQTLKDNEMWENTLLVFTTDNGGSYHHGGNNWPLRGGKMTLWEGGVRGVAFLHSESLLNNKQRGTENKGLMHITDWLPTLVTVAGGTIEGGRKLYGVNQWNMISDNLPSERTEILLGLDTRSARDHDLKIFEDTSYQTTVKAAIRVGKWKLITGHAPDDPELNWWVPAPESNPRTAFINQDVDPRQYIRLYNIEDDPSEEYELSEQHTAIVRELILKLELYTQAAIPVQSELEPKVDKGKMGKCWGPWVNDEIEIVLSDHPSI